MRKALSGLIILRSMYDLPEFRKIESDNNESKLPRLRFHYFFRNIEGLWGSLNPDDIEEGSHEAMDFGKLDLPAL